MTTSCTTAASVFLFCNRWITGLLFIVAGTPAYAWQDTGAGPDLPEPQPTPYIFYWGAIQSRIEFRPELNAYTGEAKTALNILQEALRREPRLWNGRALETDLSFVAGAIEVKSRQDQPAVYAAVKPALEGLINDLRDSILRLEKMSLPNGKTASIRVLVQKKEKADRTGAPGTAFGRPGVFSPNLQWGAGTASVEDRSYFTENEFWQIFETEPLLLSAQGDTLKVNRMKLEILAGGGAGSSQSYPEKVDSFATPDQIRGKIRDLRDQIRPGAFVWVGFYQTQTDSLLQRLVLRNGAAPKLVARPAAQHSLILVPPDDPRLELRNSDLRYFRFEWGSLVENFGPVYPRSLKSKKEAFFYPDNPMYYRSYLGVADLQELLLSKPRLKLEEQGMAGLEFKLLFKDDSIPVYGGVLPADVKARIGKAAKPGDVITLTGFKTQDFDLPGLQINLHIKYADPKQPLKSVPGELRWGLFHDDFAERFMRDANGLVIWTGEMPAMSYYYFTAPEIGQIIASPPVVEVAGKKVENLRFYLSCGGTGTYIDEKGLPDSLARRWASEIYYGLGCTLSGYRTDAADLRGLVVQLYPHRENRAFSGARKRNEMTLPAALDLVIDPSPVKSVATFTFELPGDGRVTFSLSTVFGQKIYEESRDQKGAGVYSQTFKAEFFKEKGLYYASIETPYGTVTKEFVVE